MIKNYLLVAVRHISKYKFYSAVNILGMTIGIAACLLIILYVADELSFDQFHKNASRMYQVGLHGKLGGQDIRTATTCTPLASTMVSEIPEVEDATRIIPYYSQPAIKIDEKAFVEQNVIYADSNFFQFFSFELLVGDAKTALKEPNAVVLTEETAAKYFGQEAALGKLLVIDGNERTYKVTGVAENTPANSHFKFNLIISSASNDRVQQGIWLNNWMYTYFKLHPGASIDAVATKFEAFVPKYIGPEMERFMGVSMKQMQEQGGAYGYYATPLTSIHLHSTSNNDLEVGGNILHVYFFAGIGIFILLIACINFMNLSTARSAGRAKEVGLRKTLGSVRAQMIGQFLAESTVYSLVAVSLALIFCYALLPSFNLLSGKELGMDVFIQPWFIGAIVALILMVGVVAGSYPAFYLTSFNAVEVLKGKVRAGMRSKGVRSTLVVFQFFLSIFLIIFTIVVYDQIQFMHEKNLGLDKQNVMIVRNTWRLNNNKEAFRNSLTGLKHVETVSYTNNSFPGVGNTTVFKAATSEQDHIMGLYYADYEHMNLMKFELKEGRYFSKDFPSDSTGILLNEAAAREFGFTNAVGEEILYNNGDRVERLKVIGVVKNFNFESFKNAIRPLSIRLTQNADNLMIRYTDSPKALVAEVEELWKKQASNEPFEYTFLDERFDELFRAEQRMGRIFTIFSGLAIFIASLGLFALAAFTAEQRTKEIGIRKALGASGFSLTILLSKEFTKLVIIAFIPAAVLGYYVAEQWLSGFAHRVDINPFIFVISGFSAIIIAWLTVGYQSVKAAVVNPVESLRYE